MASERNNLVIEQLTDLGLSRHEAVIYVAVLKHGECPAGVVLDEVKMHREQVYRALKRLVDGGYLTQFEKRKRSYYSAVDPKILLNQQKARVETAEKLIPYLSQLHRRKPQIIKVLEGEEALKAQIEDVIDTLPIGEEYLILGGIGSVWYQAASKYTSILAKGIAKKKFRGRVLMYEGAKYPASLPTGEYLTFKSIKRPSDMPASTIIYGNKVGMVLIEPDNISVITIENEKIAEQYRHTFEALWKTANI